MIPTFTRAYQAAVAIAGFRIVAFADAANNATIAQASTQTGAFLGVSDRQGADAGGMADVHRDGLGSVELGGTVAAGDPLTADADGKAIVAVAAIGTTKRIVGYADEPGVSGDIIDAFISPGVLHVPA